MARLHWSHTSPFRTGGRRLLALGLILGGLIAAVLMPIPGATQAGSSGGGHMFATSLNNPGRAGRPCFNFMIRGRSTPPPIPPYSGSYSVSDSSGKPHGYSGPLEVTVEVDTHEGPLGTYSDRYCNDPNPAGESDKPGYAQPINGATLRSTSTGAGGTSVSCNYPKGTYSRDGKDITIKLQGTCNITDNGATYTAGTNETRNGRLDRFNVQPVFPSEFTWDETYTAQTQCTSASCVVPSSTTTTSTTLRNATPTTLQPGPPPVTVPTPTPPTVIGPTAQGVPGGFGSVSPLASSGLANVGVPGTGFTSSVPGGGPPTPVGPGSVPGTAPTASASASSTPIPTSAAAPGTAAGPAKGSAPLPAVGFLPQGEGVPEYTMVAHPRRDPFPAPAVAAGVGLWLAFVCFVGASGWRSSAGLSRPRPAPALSGAELARTRPPAGHGSDDE